MHQKMYDKRIYAIGLSLVFNLFFTHQTHAAILSIDAPESAHQDSIFSVNISLNTENERINAVGVTINIPDALELIDIQDGNSIINFWANRPTLENNVISLEGIIPGGYEGENGILLTLVLRSKTTEKARITLTEPSIFLHDGQGTSAPINIVSTDILLEEKTETTEEASRTQDTLPPEDFTPLITKDSLIFDGDWFLIFATQDKESGIDHYTVCEGWRPCTQATSPYHLKNQNLSSEITIHAEDKKGNVRTIIIPARYPTSSTVHKIRYGIMCVFVALIATLIWRRWWEFRNR